MDPRRNRDSRRRRDPNLHLRQTRPVRRVRGWGDRALLPDRDKPRRGRPIQLDELGEGVGAMGQADREDPPRLAGRPRPLACRPAQGQARHGHHAAHEPDGAGGILRRQPRQRLDPDPGQRGDPRVGGWPTGEGIQSIDGVLECLRAQHQQRRDQGRPTPQGVPERHARALGNPLPGMRGVPRHDHPARRWRAWWAAIRRRWMQAR